MQSPKYEKPSIIIYYSSSIEDVNIFNPILHGIEEEGIPFETVEIKEEDRDLLSYKASKKSRLAVGIGIGSKGNIGLTINKFKKGNLLLSSHVDYAYETLRDLGANAGRLVKGIAFK